MFKSFKEQKELKKKAEGKVVELPDEKEVLEVSTEPVDTKIEKDDKNTFEEFKVLYKGQIDDKCLEDYGTIEDKKLWEDTAKELFMASEDYIPDEDDKAEKIEEAKEVKKESINKNKLQKLLAQAEKAALACKEDPEAWDVYKIARDAFEEKNYEECEQAINEVIDLIGGQEAFEKFSESKKIDLDRYQVREFDGPGAKFGVYDTKEKKFVQKGSKYIMNAACKDLNEKGKVTESSIIKYTLKEMMNKKQETIEEGNSIFELKFDCSNEDTFGTGYTMATSLANVLTDVATKVADFKFDGPIMDVNGNKIGSYGIGYQGVESGLSESKKVEEGIRDELIQLRKDNRGLYDYVANNYYKMSQEELKEIALDAIYVANNDSQIINELTDRYDKDEQEEYAYEIQEFSKKPYDFIANNYNNLTTEFLKEIALNAIYVADNDAKIIDEYTERMDESLNDDIEKVKKDSIKKGLYTESEDVPNITWILENYDWDVDIMTEEQLGSDYLYRKLCKNVDEAARFNYHSDYWGDADSYQDANIELMEQIEPYVGKEVIVDFDDGSQKYKILGIAIDKQYNSLSHTCILAEELGEPKTEGIEKEVNVTDANEDINSVMVTYISNQTFMKYYNLDRPLTEKELDVLKLKIKNKEMYVTDFKDKLKATEVNSRKELIPNTYVMKIKENDIDDLEESKKEEIKEVPDNTEGYDAIDYFWQEEDIKKIQDITGPSLKVSIDPENKARLIITIPNTKYIKSGYVVCTDELIDDIVKFVKEQYPNVILAVNDGGTSYTLKDKVTWKNKKQESQVSDYTFKELNKVVNDKGNDFKIQIAGSEDKTNWLNIDKEDLQAIYQALQNKKAK